MGSLCSTTTSIYQISCSVCHHNDEKCTSWRFDSFKNQVRCTCKSSNAPVSVTTLLSVSKDVPGTGTLYACPEHCGSALIFYIIPRMFIIKSTSPNKDKTNQNAAEIQIQDFEKRLTSQCHICSQRGYFDVLADQRFEKCNKCFGTGGIRCTKHHTETTTRRSNDPRFEDRFETYQDECDNCHQDTKIGWIDRCMSCSGAGQLCHKTFERRLCTHCINMPCRVFTESKVHSWLGKN